MHTLEALFPEKDFSLVAVILGLPAIGAFVNGVFGKRLGKDAVRLMALTSIGGAFLASLVAFLMLRSAGEEGAFTWTAWHWMDVSIDGGNGSAPLEVAFLVDQLSSVMMLIITGVGFLIHLYASAYMWDDSRKDGGFHRFFAYLNLFCFAMLVLVMGASLPILFVGWEGVGLCSFLLIGFWYSDQSNAAAGKKAFIANRIGDFGLLVAMALLLEYTGALDWAGIQRGAGALLERTHFWPLGHGLNVPGWLSFLNSPFTPTAATVVGLALFLGCAGKSAQIPLYVWLPDAMAGPTPVSALIHAATMVTAGLYLVCRLSGILVLSPVAMGVMAATGALTALFAATIGLAQTDIKKVLAYSTVSQLGYMFLGAGVGAFSAGFFHVFTHAFFKACLFLCAGSAIHAMHAGIHDTQASQDMRNMGGLRRFMPATYLTFLAACLAISGFPLTAGFFSKDEILYRAFVNQIPAAPDPGGGHRFQAWPWFGPLLFAIGLLSAVMTAFYMFRALFLTFWGEFRGWKVNPRFAGAHAGGAHHGAEEHHPEGASGAHAAHASANATEAGGHGDASAEGPPPHESPRAMTFPLGVLAAFALLAGFLNDGLLSHTSIMERWLEPVFAVSSHVVKTREGAPSEWLFATLGVAAFAVGAGGAYWVYIMKQGEPARELTEKAPRLYQLVFEKWRIDELYENTVIAAVDAFADTAATIDKWIIDGILARVTSTLVVAFGTLLRALQTGVVHAYAAMMVVGVGALGWFFMWQPHADTIVRDGTNGRILVEATPGLGYQFRWHSKSPDKPDLDDWSLLRSVEVDVPAGETKIVKLEVKNAFGRTTTVSIPLARPQPNAAAAAALGDIKRLVAP